MMRNRRTPFAFVVLAGGACAALIVACSDSTEDRPPFDGPDTGNANLPETGAPYDAGPPVDAAKDAKAPFDPADEPVTCASTPCPVELAAGEYHVCARMSDGTARCWGDNTTGALGSNAPATDGGAGDAGAFVVRPVVGLTNVAQISAGGMTSCARLADGSVRCWGANDTGQLGLQAGAPLSDSKPHPTPTRVAITGPVERVDIGQGSVFAILASGELWAWGDNTQRQLARSSKDEIGAPEATTTLGDLKIKRAVAGSHTVLAITESADVVSWGGVAGNEGRVSARISAVTPDALPLSIELASVSSLSVSSTTLTQPQGPRPRPPAQAFAHACAIVKGDIACWGASSAGALGTGLPDSTQLPIVTAISSEKAWAQQVAAGGEISCARLTDGSVYCAGDDSRGALGQGKETKFSMFFIPATAFSSHAVQVVTTKTSVCALVQGGTVECWGANEHGELGQGTTDVKPHSTPVKVGF